VLAQSTVELVKAHSAGTVKESSANINGTYTAAPMSWVKILNPSYSQKRGRQEMVESFRERGDATVSPV